MSTTKKCFAELIGTMVLVILGCGTAMLVGCDAGNGCGYILTALAFGLTIVGMAYCIGNISGCHINPAVSIGVYLTGGMTASELLAYIVSQCIGAFLGTFVLVAIFVLGGVPDQTNGLGANGLAGVNGNPVAGLVVEIVLTFIFVLTILGVTSKKANHGSFAGVVIGFTLTLVHIFGIGLTGTSVNPARSLAPAIVAAINYNRMDTVASLWVFIVGPVIGAVLAALIYKALESPSDAVSVSEKTRIMPLQKVAIKTPEDIMAEIERAERAEMKKAEIKEAVKEVKKGIHKEEEPENDLAKAVEALEAVNSEVLEAESAIVNDNKKSDSKKKNKK